VRMSGTSDTVLRKGLERAECQLFAPLVRLQAPFSQIVFVFQYIRLLIEGRHHRLNLGLLCAGHHKKSQQILLVDIILICR